jgi:putative FmdB family regulatory protein
MPTYEYQCNKCGHRFEVFQSMSARPVKRCPKCSGAVKRLIGAGGGIIFKGPGFYATDYRKPAPPKKSEGCKKCPSGNESCPMNKDKKTKEK